MSFYGHPYFTIPQQYVQFPAARPTGEREEQQYSVSDLQDEEREAIAYLRSIQRRREAAEAAARLEAQQTARARAEREEALRAAAERHNQLIAAARRERAIRETLERERAREQAIAAAIEQRRREAITEAIAGERKRQAAAAEAYARSVEQHRARCQAARSGCTANKPKPAQIKAASPGTASPAAADKKPSTTEEDDDAALEGINSLLGSLFGFNVASEPLTAPQAQSRAAKVSRPSPAQPDVAVKKADATPPSTSTPAAPAATAVQPPAASKAAATSSPAAKPQAATSEGEQQFPPELNELLNAFLGLQVQPEREAAPVPSDPAAPKIVGGAVNDLNSLLQQYGLEFVPDEHDKAVTEPESDFDSAEETDHTDYEDFNQLRKAELKEHGNKPTQLAPVVDAGFTDETPDEVNDHAAEKAKAIDKKGAYEAAAEARTLTAERKVATEAAGEAKAKSTEKKAAADAAQEAKAKAIDQKAGFEAAAEAKTLIAERTAATDAAQEAKAKTIDRKAGFEAAAEAKTLATERKAANEAAQEAKAKAVDQKGVNQAAAAAKQKRAGKDKLNVSAPEFKPHSPNPNAPFTSTLHNYNELPPFLWDVLTNVECALNENDDHACDTHPRRPKHKKTKAKHKAQAAQAHAAAPAVEKAAAPAPAAVPKPAAAESAKPAPAKEATPEADESNPERDASLKEIAGLQEKLDKINSAFVFPPALGFAASPADASQPPLLFNRHNSAYHAHAHDLLQLLLATDGVQSNGDKVVRRRRKELVRGIEQALQDLETKRDARWKEVKARRERGESDDESNWPGSTTEGTDADTESFRA